MAIARTSILEATGTSATYTSSSFTPPADSLLVVAIEWADFGKAKGALSAGLTISGGGLTWTPRVGQDPCDTASDNVGAYQQIWTAPVGASPSSMTVAISSVATPTNPAWDANIVAYTGYDVGSPIGATGSSKSNTNPLSGAFSLTLSGAPASTSMVFAALGAGPTGSVEAVTNGSGWTEIYDANTGDPGLQSQERTGSTSTSVDWVQVGASGRWHCGGLAIEIKELAGNVGTLLLTGNAVNLKYGPWELVGVGGVVQSVATGHTLTLPAGVAQGDLLVAVISSRIASTASITLPTGGEWTLVGEQKTNNVLTTTSAVASGLMAYCVRGASDPNLTFTHPVAPSVALGRIVAYRGVNASSPKDTQNAVTTAINTTAVSVAGVTTAGANELLVVGACGGQEAAWSAFDAVTSPTVASGATNTTNNPTYNTWLERADSNTTTGADTSLAIADAVKTAAGATGNITATASLGASHVIIIGAFKTTAPSGSPYTMAAGTGTVALDGKATGLKYGHVMAGGLGTLTLAGQNAGLVRTGVSVHGAWDSTVSSATLSNGDRTAAGGFLFARSTDSHAASGVVNYYSEVKLDSTVAGFIANVGITDASLTNQVYTDTNGALSDSSGFLGTFPSLAFVAGDVVGIAYIPATGKVWIRVNGGNWNGSGTANPATNTGGINYASANPAFVFASGSTSSVTTTINTGTVAFAFTQPSGFRSWWGPLVMAAGQGTLTLAGQANVLRTLRRMPAALGTITLAGQTATLKRSVVMPVTLGTLTLSGQTSALRCGRKLVAGLGTLTLSGQVAATRVARRVPAGLGTITLSGQSATLLYGVGRVLPVSQGTLTLSGQTATLRYARTMTAGLGTLTLSGVAAQLRYTRVPLAAGLGTITINGQVVKTAYGRVVPHTVGTITINGQTSRLVWAHKGAAALGTITLGGQTTNLVYSGAGSKVLPVTVGTLVMSGQIAVLRYARVLPVTFGTVTINGQSASLRYGHKTAAGTGVVALSGQTVTLRPAWKVVVTTGTIALNGQSTTLKYSHAAGAGLGTLTLSGPVVNLIYSGAGSKVLPAGVGSLVINGQPVVLRYARKTPAGLGTITLGGQTALLRSIRRVAVQNGNIVLSGQPAALLRSAPAFQGVKVWNGSAWVEKPAKVWSGSAWVTKPVKAWNGSAWV